MSLPKTEQFLRRRYTVLATALVVTAVFGMAAYAKAGTPRQQPAKAAIVPAAAKPQMLAGVPVLDRDSEQFLTQTAGITRAPECFPIHIRDQGRIGILYLYCSNDAYNADAEPVDVSENFSVPQGIARRYNFWRRIYSLWGKDQYVMHLSEYPEVILEAFDVSRAGENVGAIQREIMVKRVAKGQREQYKKLFLAMHKNRNNEAAFTPAMQRLARVMAHIPSGDKYLIAARTLRLQRGQRDFIASGLMTAPKYLPAIEKEFEEQGIPVEISRLAFIESSFNLSAHSKVGASGVYQIMPATGRQYLKMHSGVDERNDPIKASRAAAKLLKLNYSLTGSWPLAVTAYNHGVGGIRKATRAVGTNDLTQLINRYYGSAFGFASKNFFAGYLGLLATLKDADKIFPEVPKVMPLQYENVRLAQATSLTALKRKYTLTSAEIAEYNPDISRGLIRSSGYLPRGYVLKVPARSEAQVLNASSPPNS